MAKSAAVSSVDGSYSSSDANTPKDESRSVNGSIAPEHVDGVLNNTSQHDLEKQIPPPGSDPDPNIVVWEADDGENPHTWSLTRKWFVTTVLNTLPLVVNVGSSILSGSGKDIGNEYHVSSEVTILITSLFLMVNPALAFFRVNF